MSFSSLGGRRVLLLAVFLTVAGCLSTSINVYSQSFHSIEKYDSGAIDPRLFDTGNQLQNRSLNNSSSGNNSSTKKTEAAARTASALDPSLNIAVDAVPGNARSIVLQSDGKILVGGYFKTLNGLNYKSIVRLNTDNSIDGTFNAGTNGTILAIAIQSNGKIVIGGSFTVVNGTNQNRIARLNADGSLDTTFNTGIGASGVVYDVAVQADGKILLGGSFIAVGMTLNFNVARLNADGSLDTTFTSPIQAPSPFAIPSIVYSVALQSDGKIILGGLIIPSGTGPVTTTPITRLNANGTIDSSFNPGIINSNAYKVAVLADGKILMGGFFSTINGVSHKYLAKLNANGSVDDSFNNDDGIGGPVFSFFNQTDGKILIGGVFTTVNGATRLGVARLKDDGSLDDTFAPNSSSLGTVYSVVSGANGKVLTGGSFPYITGQNRDTIKVFNSNGLLDTSATFTSTALGGVRAVVAQADGKILVSGSFSRINGVAQNRLVRLNPDGTIDNTFSTPIFSGLVTKVFFQPDGKILVGGNSLGINNQTFVSLLRLNPDGTLDTSFIQENSLTFANCITFSLQPDGKILFSYLLGRLTNGQSTGITRYNADGSLDTSFTSGLSYNVEAFVPLPDGKILIGGPFYISYVGSGQQPDPYYGVLRLNADGSHDRGFHAGFFSDNTTPYFTSVYSLALQADGKILVGGSLFTANGTQPVGAARLNSDGTLDESFQRSAISSTTELAHVEDLQLLPNGKIGIGGRFNALSTSTALNNVARLNANGSVDDTFTANTDDTVYDVALQADGKILIGGDFNTVDGTARTSLARLLGESVTQRRTIFDFDGDGKTDVSIFRPGAGEWWYQRSSDNQVSAAQFGDSTAKIVPADFTGDGKTDIAYWKPSTGEWFVLRSDNSTYYAFPFGANGDIPFPADYDGDGRADAAVFRPSTATWYINKSTGGVTIQQFGASGDIPEVSDYDGDGKADIAIFRPVGAGGSAEWWVSRSSDNNVFAVAFGAVSDKPVPADYTGDGKADAAFFRPSTGEWFVLRSENLTYYAAPFGTNGDIPVSGDYDGDGKADFAVFRPSNSTWFALKSGGGVLIQGFGVTGDIPVPSAFVP